MARRGSDLPKLELLAVRAPVELIQDLEDIAERRGEPNYIHEFKKSLVVDTV